MSSTNYRQYVSNTLTLARSLTIKSDASIIGINQHVKALGHPVSDDPTTWRYYQNLAGVYHALDVPMHVTSLDTLEVIPFTVESLKEHLVTRTLYQPGSEYYQAMVEKYPAQELLIRGVLNPIDIHDAIAAPDFSILHHDPQYVESNETNLMELLQDRINAFAVRWNNPAYAVHDDLYVTANLAVLFGRLPGWLMNIRLNNCNTRFVHSFHIREYLKSHGRLDRYFDYLSKAQSLWLYRNISYLERNAGKQDTFEWLVDNLLSKRGMGLAEFNLRHNVKTLTEDLRPEIEFTRESLNRFHRSYRAEEHSLDELLRKQRPLATRNRRDESRALSEDVRRMEHAPRNRLRTKVMESAIIDWSESGSIPRTQFLLNHWAHWAMTGKYRAIVRVTHPRTNAQLELPVDDAWMLFLYAYNRTVGVTLETLPAITAQAIRRQPTPSYAQLRGLVETGTVLDAMIRQAANVRFSERSLLSPYQFVQTTSELYTSFSEHREVYALQEHSRTRGQVQALMDHLYMNVDTRHADHGESYTRWFRKNGYDVSDLSILEYGNLADSVLEEATGIKLLSTHSPAAIQQALISILSQLSSYSVQYIQEVNAGPIVFWDWPATRVGDTHASAGSDLRAPVLSRAFSEARFKGHQSLHWDVQAAIKPQYRAHGHIHHLEPMNVKLSTVDRRVDSIRLPLASTRMDVVNMG